MERQCRLDTENAGSRPRSSSRTTSSVSKTWWWSERLCTKSIVRATELVGRELLGHASRSQSSMNSATCVSSSSPTESREVGLEMRERRDGTSVIERVLVVRQDQHDVPVRPDDAAPLGERQQRVRHVLERVRSEHHVV